MSGQKKITASEIVYQKLANKHPSYLLQFILKVAFKKVNKARSKFVIVGRGRAIKKKVILQLRKAAEQWLFTTTEKTKTILAKKLQR